jgi:hypothetical protein
MHSLKAKKADMLPLCKFLKDAVVVGVVRGDDSTGMFQVQKNMTVREYKLPYSGEVFAMHHQAQTFMNEADECMLTVGHHRAATRGGVSQQNCHPFEYYDNDRHVIGVHNGFVNGMPWKEDGYDFQVDSDWLYYRIFRDGAPKAIGSMTGAMALAWYENDGKLRLYSNGARSLFWAYMKDQECMVFASEHGMLWWLAGDEQRANIDLDTTIFYPEPDVIYVFDPDNVRNFEKIPIEKPAATNVVHRNGHVRAASDNTEYKAKIVEDGYPNRPLKSFQNFTMNYFPGPVRDMGAKPGARLEFFVGKIYKNRTGNSNVVGEVLINDEPVYALLPYVSDALVENLELIEKDNKACVEATVVGSVGIYYEGKEHQGLILNNVSITIGDKSLLRNKEEQFSLPRSEIALLPGPNGSKLTPAAFGTMASGGCQSCGKPLSPQMAVDGEIDWIGGDVGKPSPVCVGCMHQMSGSLPVNPMDLHDV